MKSNRVRVFIFAAFSLVSAAFAQAATDFKVLIDVDNNPSTGCSVATSAGTMQGVEQVITTTVDTSGVVPMVTGIVRQPCAGSSLGTPVTVSAGGYPAGSSTRLLIETQVPADQISSTPLNRARIAFVVSNGTYGDAIITRASGDPILFPQTIGRRRAVPQGPLRNIIADGTIGDWGPILSLADGTSSTGTSAFRFNGVYGYANEMTLTFLADVLTDPSAPTAVDDNFVVLMGKALNIAAPGVLGNDIEPQHKPLTALLISGPQHGTLNLNANGGFSYVNDGSNAPVDSFRYKASNGTATSNAAQVTIAVTANHSPSANADSYNVAHRGTLTVPAAGVLANDTDQDGDTLHAVLVQTPAHGTLTLNSNGSFTYTHDGSNTLVDTFRYRAADAYSSSNAATVTITIAADIPPTSVADSYTVAEGGTLVVAAPGVFANDSDPDTPQSFWTMQIVAQPAHGTVTPNGGGAFTYVHDGSETTSDSFTYNVNDGISTGNTVTVSITVTPVNDPPVANNDAYTLLEDTPLNVPAPGVLANDTDVDSGTLTAAVVTSPAHGTLTLNANGSFLYTPASNYNGSDSFTYRANDGSANSAPATVSLTITAVNDVPSFTSGGTVNVNEDSGAYSAPWATSVSAGPADEAGQALTFQITNNTNAALFATQPAISPTGVLTFTPAANTSGTANITVQLHDNGGTANGGVDTSAPQTFTINVNAVNDPPVNTVPGAQTVAEDATLTLSGANAISVADIDAGAGTLTVTLGATNGTLTLGGTAGLTVTGNGTSSVQATGTIAALNTGLAGTVYAPTADFAGSDTITVSTNDNGNTGAGGPLTTNSSIPVTVTAVNDAPVITRPASVTANEDSAFSFSGPNVISIADVDAASGSVTVTLGVTNGALTLNGTTGLTVTGDGTNSITASGTLANLNAALSGMLYLASANYTGSDTLTIGVNDNGNTGTGGPLTDSKSVSITITAVNDAPTLSLPPTQTVNEDATLTFSSGNGNAITVADVDAGAGIVSVTLQSANGNITVGSTAGLNSNSGNGTGNVTITGTIAALNASLNGTTFVPSSNYNGSTSISVSVDDNGNTGSGGAQQANGSIPVTVTAVNDAPVITRPATVTTAEDTPLTLNGGNTISIADVDAASGSVTVTLGVSNGVLALSGTAGLTVSGNGTNSITASGTLTNVNAALNGLVYTPSANYNGGDTLSIGVNDNGNTGTGGPLTDSKSVAITVTPVNDAPTISSGNTITYTENGAPIAVNPAIGISDIDSANLQSALVLITGNFAGSQDVLACPGCSGAISASYNAGSGTLTLTGTDTVANYQTALRSVTYVNTSDNPSTAQRGIDWYVTDSSGAQSIDSLANDTAINVVAVNDAPVVTAGNTLAYTENQAPASMSPALTVTDVDSANLVGATVQISANYVNGEDVLAFTNTANITGSFNAATGTMTLTGTDTVANYQAALRSITYANTSENPTPASRTVSWQVDDGNATNHASNVANSTITVTPVNDAPTVTPSTNLSYTEAQGAVVLDGGVTVTDPDSATLTGATVQITGNYANGQDVLAMAPFGAITASFNAATGTLTLTGTTTIANYQAALRTVTYTNTSNAPSTLTRTVTWNANDGAATGAGLTSTISVTSINTPPTVTTSNAPSYTENAAPVTLEPSLSVTDPDSATLAGATISITSGFASGQDVLSFTAAGSITGSYNAATGVLTLSGTDTVANYQTALRSVKYSNSSENPSTTTRVATWVVNDGTDPSAPATTSITVIAVNDAPTVVAGSTVGYTENAAPTTLEPSLTVTDPDNTNLTGATVQITGNFNSAQDVLAATASGGVSVSYNSATGMLTLSGTASVSAYQTVMRSVTYVNTSDSPTVAPRTITWLATDGAATSSAATTTVNVTAVDDAPVVTAGATLSYTENQAATAIDTTITVNDVDNANLASATVQITANYVNGQDVLSFTNTASITGSFNAATGTLTLTGSDTVANYQAALRAVKYNNTSDNPSTAARTVSWNVNDGTLASSTVTSTINVTAVNDAPVVTAGATLAYTENQAATAIDNTITVTDVDNANLASATAQITANYANGQDVLSFTNTANITGSFNAATGTLTLTGSDTVANYQAALRSVKYVNTSESPSSATRTVTWIVNDGALASAGATSSITVAPVNDAPVVTAGGTLNYTEADPATAIDTTVTVTDVDNANLASATVQITANYINGQDVLSFTNTASITGSFNAATGTMTLTGSDTVANYQAALRNVKYNNTSNAPSAAPRTVSFSVNDGTAASNVATSTINVTPVNSAPVVTAGATLAYTENQPAVAISPALTVTDVDSPNITTATIQITANYVNGEDVLSFTNTANITGSFNATTGTLTLTGVDTVSNYQTALRNVKYNNTSENPSTAARTVTYTVTDQDAAPLTSAPATSTINVTAVPDPPVVTINTASITFTEGDAATVLDGALTVTDVDSTNANQATVTISANYQNGSDVLACTSTGTITCSFNAATGVLTLSGTDTLANYQALLRTVTFINNSQAPTTTARTISWVVKDSSNTSSSAVTSTVNVVAVNDAPTISNPASLSINEDTPITLNGGNLISVADVDGGTGIEKVSLDVSHGTINLASVTGLTFVDATANNSSSVHFTGTLTNLNNAMNGMTYTPAANFNNTRGSEALAVVINDQGNTGTGGALTASVSIPISIAAVNDAPVAKPKSLSAQAHMKITYTINLANDGSGDVTDADIGDGGYTPTFTLATVTPATCAGCVITNINAATGTFDFEPGPGLTGSVTLNYTVSDNGNPGPGLTSAAGTITVNIAGPVIWFVDAVNGNDANNGTLSHPFKTLTPVAPVDAAGHRIFLFGGTYTAGITLNSNEWIIGQGITTAFDTYFGITPPAGTIARPSTSGANPNLAARIVVATNDKLDGLDMDGTAAQIDNYTTGVFPTGTATAATGLTVNVGRMRRTGAGNVIAIGGTGNTGTFNFKSVSAVGVGGSTQHGVFINSFTGPFTVAGTDSGLTPNGGTISGFGGDGMHFSTISNGASTAVSLSKMTLTGNGISQSVAGSNTTCGGDLAGGTNTACVANLYLTSATKVALDTMTITNSGQMGINGNGVTDFTLTNSTVTGNGNESFENGITIVNLNGTSSIVDTTVKDNAARQIFIHDKTGTGTFDLKKQTLGTMVVGYTTFQNGSSGFSQQGLLFEVYGSATPTLRVDGISFQNNFGNAVDIEVSGTASNLGGSLNGYVQNCNVLGGGAGLLLENQYNAAIGTSTATPFLVQNNTGFTRHQVQAMAIGSLVPTTAGLFVKVANNQIGTTGFVCDHANAHYVCDGIDIVRSSTGVVDVTVSGNTIQKVDGSSIALKINSTGNAAFKVASNSVTQPDFGSCVSNNDCGAIGLFGSFGASAGGSYCLDVSGNTFTGDATFGWDPNGAAVPIELFSKNSSVVSVNGMGANPPNTYISGQNGGAGVFTSTATGGTFVGGGACSVP